MKLRGRLKVRLSKVRSRLFTPVGQVVLALAGMWAGAWVVGRVVFGLTILLSFLALFLDGLFRNPGGFPDDARGLTVNDVLERQRRAR